MYLSVYAMSSHSFNSHLLYFEFLVINRFINTTKLVNNNFNQN